SCHSLFLVRHYALCLLLTLTARIEIYTLSLHDALPDLLAGCVPREPLCPRNERGLRCSRSAADFRRFPLWMWRNTETASFVESRSEEHTSELQSRENLVCRLLLEKKTK